MDTKTEVPLFWFLGTLLPITMAWMGVGVAVVLTVALLVEVFWQRQVKERLRNLDVYLPSPSPWQLSAALVRYNYAYADPSARH